MASSKVSPLKLSHDGISRWLKKKTDGKTKNSHFCEMISLAKRRGIKPSAVVIDAWYSSLKNSKSICDHGWTWVTTLRENTKVNRDASLETLEIYLGQL